MTSSLAKWLFTLHLAPPSANCKSPGRVQFSRNPLLRVINVKSKTRESEREREREGERERVWVNEAEALRKEGRRGRHGVIRVIEATHQPAFNATRARLHYVCANARAPTAVTARVAMHAYMYYTCDGRSLSRSARVTLLPPSAYLHPF